MSKTARVYKAELLIRNRGHVSFQTLLDELEVSPATLKRDLDYLKDQLGAPIVYDRFLNGYKFGEEYRGQKHELPGLWFSERELYSLLMAHQLLNDLDTGGVISRRLQPLLERIQQMLGASKADTTALMKRVKIIGTAKRPVPSRFFELVGEGLLKRQQLRLRYLTRGRGEVSGMCHRNDSCAFSGGQARGSVGMTALRSTRALAPSPSRQTAATSAIASHPTRRLVVL